MPSAYYKDIEGNLIVMSDPLPIELVPFYIKVAASEIVLAQHVEETVDGNQTQN